MIRLSILPLVAVVLATAARAGEITIEPRPFTIEIAFTATALPDKDCMLLVAEPRVWTEFRIAALTAHGSRVAKGDLLVRFETQALDQKLAVTRRLLDSSARTESQLTGDLKQLEDQVTSRSKTEPELLRLIEQKTSELATLQAARLRDQELLAGLEADRKLCEFKAPGAGWFYHGSIENGRWMPPVELLVKHGCPPAWRAFATFIPATTKLGWVAFVDEATARALKPDLTGIATLAGREDLELPVKLTQVASVPGVDGSWRVDLAATWRPEVTVVTGASARIRLIAYHQAAAITISNNALEYAPAGWTVEVKLADGKTARRVVKRGRVWREQTEILDGLEAGQVVIAP